MPVPVGQVAIYAYAPPLLRDRIDVYARRFGMSRSDIIRIAIQQLLEKETPWT